jgi:YegS/Rv2252/BmrU family lipid kinase
MRTAVIVNPRAAGGRTGHRWPALSERLAAALGPFTVRMTMYRGHAIAITRDLLASGFERIIAAGGDGTVNEAANGFLTALPGPAECAFLGVLPAGAGGDFARTLGMPIGGREAIDALAAARPVPIDAAVARPRAAAPRYFLNVASFGIGGEVARRRRMFPGEYLPAAAFALARWRVPRVELSLDGGAPLPFHIAHVAIGNGQYQGAGIRICPAARIDDGVLEVTVVRNVALTTLIRDVRVLYSGNLANHPKVACLRASRVEARSPEAVALELDGDPFGALPAEFAILPSALRVLVPRP